MNSKLVVDPCIGSCYMTAWWNRARQTVWIQWIGNLEPGVIKSRESGLKQESPIHQLRSLALLLRAIENRDSIPQSFTLVDHCLIDIEYGRIVEGRRNSRWIFSNGIRSRQLRRWIAGVSLRSRRFGFCKWRCKDCVRGTQYRDVINLFQDSQTTEIVGTTGKVRQTNLGQAIAPTIQVNWSCTQRSGREFVREPPANR